MNTSIDVTIWKICVNVRGTSFDAQPKKDTTTNKAEFPIDTTAIGILLMSFVIEKKFKYPYFLNLWW